MKRALIIASVVVLALAALLEAQTTGINDQETQRFVLPGTNTTGFRVHASNAHMSVSIPRGNIAAMGGYKVAFVYAHGDQSSASLTNSVMPVAGTTRPSDSGSGIAYQRVPFKGSVIGVAIGASTALTAGTATAEATILRAGDVVFGTGLTTVLSSSSPQYNAAQRERDLSTFTAVEAVGCRLTTNAAFAPVTAELVCTVIIEF